MTKSMGSHTFKWGYYFNTAHYNGFGLQNIAGNVSFNRLSTSIPLNTNQAAGGGSSFAAFLLGQVSGYSLDTTRYLAKKKHGARRRRARLVRPTTTPRSATPWRCW